MALTQQQLDEIFSKLMHDKNHPYSLLKGDIAPAVAAADAWVDANAASFNAALPQPFRGTATLQEKVLLLAYILMKRIGKI